MFVILLACLVLLNVVNVQAAENEGVIFVGDSRTVGMQNVADKPEDNIFYVAEVGKGYDWFCDKAVNDVADIIKHSNYTEWKIIVLLGVNDLDNVEQYKQRYKDLLYTDWQDYELYIVSVNAIDEEKYEGTITNERIQEFNDSMSYYRRFIDTYKLSEEILSTNDGIHYSDTMYRRLYDEIISYISK